MLEFEHVSNVQVVLLILKSKVFSVDLCMYTHFLGLSCGLTPDQGPLVRLPGTRAQWYHPDNQVFCMYSLSESLSKTKFVTDVFQLL